MCLDCCGVEGDDQRHRLKDRSMIPFRNLGIFLFQEGGGENPPGVFLCVLRVVNTFFFIYISVLGASSAPNKFLPGPAASLLPTPKATPRSCSTGHVPDLASVHTTPAPYEMLPPCYVAIENHATDDRLLGITLVSYCICSLPTYSTLQTTCARKKPCGVAVPARCCIEHIYSYAQSYHPLDQTFTHKP